MAEAMAQRAEIAMNLGATQSSHAHKAAAFAAKLGRKCHIPRENRTGFDDANYTTGGNVLLCARLTSPLPRQHASVPSAH